MIVPDDVSRRRSISVYHDAVLSQLPFITDAAYKCIVNRKNFDSIDPIDKRG
jgi:hypothetical protein